ncbi:Cytochrome P450 71B10 [Bienertia sinuspersici]
MDYASIVVCLVLTWAAIYLLSFRKKGNEPNQRKQPPGPPALAIFWKIFSLDTMPHISLMELAKKYGPVMMLQLGQVPPFLQQTLQKKRFKKMMFLSLSAMLSLQKNMSNKDTFVVTLLERVTWSLWWEKN